ncbi:MAG: IS200/IS605 family transposase [Bacteroidetes bacterium]|nr:IS200/IS605 family transposase [Bacteroidota bacterium]
MANTYTQIYLQIVFVVKGRQNLISETNREELQKFISGIVQNRGQKLIAIYCMPDHTHVLVGFKPSISISDLVRDIKAAYSKFINEQNWIQGKFNWQEGFGAFSYGHWDLDKVAKYILNQKGHHTKKRFKEEYLELLKDFDISYDQKYLFDFEE